MQTLLLAFDKRGFSLSLTPEGARVTILDEQLGFSIEEGLKKVAHAVTFTEQKLIDRGLGYQVPKFDHVPSGDLILVITNVHGLRQRWSEGAYKPAESLLNKFIAGLVKAALRMKKQRADAERRAQEQRELERQRQEEAQRQAEAELRWREEKGRVERLERLAAMSRRNRELRALVSEVREAIGDVEPDSVLGQWVAWASEFADRSDPLASFRNRDGKTFTLYYHGYDHQRVKEEGFTEPDRTPRAREKDKAGVELTERPPRARTWKICDSVF
jgi:hypothetical protein